MELTSQEIKEKEIDEAVMRQYLGGCGFGSKLLFDYTTVEKVRELGLEEYTDSVSVKKGV